jgi:hypothetical protein
MPKGAQIRALPTLGHGEGLKLFGVNCSSSNKRNEIKFSISTVEREKFRAMT